MKYYLKPWHQSKFESKTKVLLQNNMSVIRYVRRYNGKEATFYTDDCILYRNMYVFVGDFLEKAVLSYLEIKQKCSDSSIKSAFEDCPNIYAYLENYTNGNDSPIIILNTKEGDYYCLKESYCTIFYKKKWNFNNLNKIAENFRKEIPLIKTYRLKPSFMQRAKNFFLKSSKYALKFVVRAGVIIAGSAIGANLDLPDFDFDIDVPDFDTDYDFDIDTRYETGYEIADNSAYNFSSESSGYNVSFGAQDATLKRSGGGLGSLDVTITKEPGSSNLFCITDGTHTIHDIPGGTRDIKIDGIKYILPKLKG